MIDQATQYIACATNVGRLLVFPAAELPQLSRGKGNKLINIPSIKAQRREEIIVDVQLLGPGDLLMVHAGKRHFTLKESDIAPYRGERSQRGHCLPRGLQTVTALEVISAKSK